MIKRTEKIERIFDRIKNRKTEITASKVDITEITSDIMDIGALTSTPEVAHETEAKKEDREHKTFFWLCVCIFVALVIAFAENYK